MIRYSGRKPIDIINMGGSAAAALADDTANPTAFGMGTYLHGFDGTTWDRLRTSSAGDNLTTGILAAGLYAWTGAVMNRMSTASGATDGIAGTVILTSALEGFNGTTWDRVRNNSEVTPFSSAARTTTTNSSDLTNYNARGIRLHLDITAVSGTSPTLDITIQALINGVYIAIAGAAFAQKTATGTDELVIYPGIAETANESVSDIVPRVWRAVATIGGSSPSFTFSLGGSYVL